MLAKPLARCALPLLSLALVHCGTEDGPVSVSQGPAPDEEPTVAAPPAVANVPADPSEAATAEDEDNASELTPSFVMSEDADLIKVLTAKAFARIRSKVMLRVDDPGCPRTLETDTQVPWRCLTIVSGRHVGVPPGAAIAEDDVINIRRFKHVIRRNLDPQLEHSWFAQCRTSLRPQPNGIVDLHEPGIRKFVALGKGAPAEPQLELDVKREFDVIAQPSATAPNEYTLVAVRPKILVDQPELFEWREVNVVATLGICLKLGQ